jgi:hypothetical protein
MSAIMLPEALVPWHGGAGPPKPSGKYFRYLGYYKTKRGTLL